MSAKKKSQKSAVDTSISPSICYDARVSKVVTGIRKAIEDCPESRYAISLGTGVSQSQLSNFVRKKASLTIENLERLADYLGLEIILRRRRRKG